MYVDVAFKGALQHARNWFPMHSRSSYVKKSNNAEAVEAKAAVCGGGGRRSVNDT